METTNLNTRVLTDSEIISKLLKHYRYTANSFAKEIGLSASAIYHILNGTNKISDDLCTRIVIHFPDTSYAFLRTGKEPISKNVQARREVQEQKTEVTLNDIPETLKNIENLLREILAKL